MVDTGHIRTRRIAGKKKQPFTESVLRERLLTFIILFAGAALIVRLFFVQVLSHERWAAAAEDQHNAFQPLSAERGGIFMHDADHLYPLAINREFPTLYVVPRDAEEKDRIAVELSGITGIEATVIREKLEKPNDPFEIIKKRLSDDEADRVRQLGLRGVGLRPEQYRYYPAGELASQVVGFATIGEGEGAGGYGIEASEESVLRGTAGQVTQEKDAAGRWIPLSDRSVDPARDGDDIVLTLDRVIQYETEKILRDSIEKYGADRATAIVMDPKTGSILSMASVPEFDPNKYSEVEDYALFMNPAVSVSYEPGSIMKPLTMAIGIEDGKVSPMTEYTDTGVVHEAGYDIRNAEGKTYGRSDMYKVLDQSINTGVIFVEKLVGNARFSEYVKRFGFGDRTGVNLPAELPGNTRNLVNPRSDIQFFTASFGQGIATTPLQMANAYAALANGGTLMRPRIIDRIVHADGTEEEVQPEAIRRVVSEETAEAMGKMLRSVVVNGHGKRANVPGYLVGGKTGTAQVAKGNAKGYEDGVSIGSFVGYAPINDPKFVILVKLDNPKNVEWAESSAAPTFGEIMKFLLEYAKVEPTEEIPVKK
jgi:cell division protein FtsI/penicillin-binding protein 2